MPKVLIDFSTPEELNIAAGELRKLWGTGGRPSAEWRVEVKREPLPLDSPDECPKAFYDPVVYSVRATVLDAPLTVYEVSNQVLAPPPVLVLKVRRAIRRFVDSSHVYREFRPGTQDWSRECQLCGRKEVRHQVAEHEWTWVWEPPELLASTKGRKNA